MERKSKADESESLSNNGEKGITLRGEDYRKPAASFTTIWI